MGVEPYDTKPAEALAGALDAEDYEEARLFLAHDCVYEIRAEIIRGADAIIGSYRTNAEAGRKRFDTVQFQSSVSRLGSDRARIDYTDTVTRSGDTLVHRCAQEVEYDDSGQIRRIVHIDLPGEREKLEAFKASHP